MSKSHKKGGSTSASLISHEAPAGVAQTADPLKERQGLTSAEVAVLVEQWGYNELEVLNIPLWKVLCYQFMGTMPYMLELSCILALIVQDFLDFAIILTILLCNGFLGFHEELKAAESLEKLKTTQEQKLAVVRDGRAEQLVTRFLVPGDVVLLKGGDLCPADVDWLEGDVLQVGTAPITGEPLPRKYPSEKYGTLIYSDA